MTDAQARRRGTPREIKLERRQLSSQCLDRSLMYPGVSIFTWIRAPWGWLLIDINPEERKP